MSTVLTWWRGLSRGTRWAIIGGVVLLALVALARLWVALGAILVGAAGGLGSLLGRVPAHPGAVEAAHKARAAANAASRAATTQVEATAMEGAAAAARDADRDQVIAQAAAGELAGAPAVQVDEEESEFLRRVRDRGGRP